jgi:single-stranded DNA-binding protein
MPRSNRNKINLSGLLVDEPELTVENGSDVLHMEVRSRRYRRRKGELVEYFDFLKVDVHGQYARQTAGHVRKRMVVDITGRVEARDRPVEVDGEYVYDSEGEQVTYPAVTIVAIRVKPLSSPAKAKRQPPSAERSDAQDGDDEAADSSPAGESPPEHDGQPEVRATEGAAELAREHSIDLAKVEGHGQVVDGVATVIKADVKKAVAAAEGEAAEAAELRRQAAREVAGEGPVPAAQAS